MAKNLGIVSRMKGQQMYMFGFIVCAYLTIGLIVYEILTPDTEERKISKMVFYAIMWLPAWIIGIILDWKDQR